MAIEKCFDELQLLCFTQILKTTPKIRCTYLPTVNYVCLFLLTRSRLKVEYELFTMLENKTKPPFNPPENKYSHASEEIYCSVEDLKTRNTKKPCSTDAQPAIRGALKELSFNKVFHLCFNVQFIEIKQSHTSEYE